MSRSTLRIGLIVILVIALVGRVLLLASGSVSFHSDEAVVALMARHILQGERPVFFYGQPYMGSLDAWLIAIGFRLLGESVLTIRVVQSALYLVFVATTYLVAWMFSRRLTIAFAAGLIVAVPSTLVALYTTATLGGYNETLVLGNLLLLLAYTAAHERQPVLWRWALMGLVAGLGWWSHALIVIYAVPIGLYVIYRTFQSGGSARRWQVLVIALIAFFVGSAPWWIYTLQHEWTPLRFLLPAALRGESVSAAVEEVSLLLRLIGLFLLGLPSVMGMRFPWLPDYFAPLIAIVVLMVYIAAFYTIWPLSKRNASQPDISPLLPGTRAILLGMVGMMGLLFLVSGFSNDPSGRYFLPLVVPFAVMLAVLVDRIISGSNKYLYRLVGIGIALMIIGYQAAGQITAARETVGLTTQFHLQTHIPNTYDTALINWLDQQGISRGYTHYWIAFRFAFLSKEQLQLSAALPYKSDLTYTPVFERIPAYRAAVDSSDRVAYITANVPEVEQGLEAWFRQENITYQTAQVGVFRIYYDFSPVIPRPPVPFIR